MNAYQSESDSSWDLSTLSHVKLDARHNSLLEVAQSTNTGSPAWRNRKHAEILDLCRLSQISGRLNVLQVDLMADLRVDVILRVTVPCLPNPHGALEVANCARLGIVYREESLIVPQPGFSVVQILAPRCVWHANVSFDPVQALCLGPRLPAGLPLREIILMSYGALTLMTVQLDPANAAGVLNPAAADWFQRNPQLIPLSREHFLQPR